jgi:hypothetical protein
VGEVENLAWNGIDGQCVKELSRDLRDLVVGLRNIKKASDDTKTQWIEKELSAAECVRQVKASQMTVTEARNASVGEETQEAFCFEQSMG